MIKQDNAWKGGFDIIMLMISCYNIFGNAYVAAFGISMELHIVIIEQAVESFFLLDMVFSFCQEYLDEETYVVVNDLRSIAKHYLKKNFVFDLLAWIPFEYIGSGTDVRLFRLLKLLRLPRLADLLNVEKFKQIVNSYCDSQSKRHLRNKNEDAHYPNRFALMIVKFYRVFALVLIIFGCSYFIGIVFHIFVVDIENWQHRGKHTMIDVFNGQETFYTGYNFASLASSDAMIKMWYFSLTTLSTIGYGDYTPKSIVEKLVVSVIMVMGVTVFSYIMGNLMDLLLSYR